MSSFPPSLRQAAPGGKVRAWGDARGGPDVVLLHWGGLCTPGFRAAGKPKENNPLGITGCSMDTNRNPPYVGTCCRAARPSLASGLALRLRWQKGVPWGWRQHPRVPAGFRGRRVWGQGDNGAGSAGQLGRTGCVQWWSRCASVPPSDPAVGRQGCRQGGRTGRCWIEKPTRGVRASSCS